MPAGLDQPLEERDQVGAVGVAGARPLAPVRSLLLRVGGSFRQILRRPSYPNIRPTAVAEQPTIGFALIRYAMSSIASSR